MEGSMRKPTSDPIVRGHAAGSLDAQDVQSTASEGTNLSGYASNSVLKTQMSTLR